MFPNVNDVGFRSHTRLPIVDRNHRNHQEKKEITVLLLMQYHNIIRNWIKKSNYRPISLTSILCKVLEHIVATNVVSHMDKHNLLYDLQHGFRSKRSCETQLVTLIEADLLALVCGV